MKILVESLKRLYDEKKVSEEKIIEMCKKGTINEIDKNYILGKE